jgi:hypothetical protein
MFKNNYNAIITVIDYFISLFFDINCLENLELKEFEMTKKIIISAAVVGAIIVGCGSSESPVSQAALVDNGSSGILGQVEPIPPKFRLRTGLDGTAGLYCDNPNAATVYDSKDYNTSATQVASSKKRISSVSLNDVDRTNPTGHNEPHRFGVVAQARSADGNITVDGLMVHPLLVSYIQQIKGDYEMGEGSADIGDPSHVDGVFVSFSLDDGKTWKKYVISDTTDKSSTKVLWNGAQISYPGHAQKPTMAIDGKNVVVAWNDKYCPSGNPLGLESVVTTTAEGTTTTYPADYFAINGNQGFVDYAGIAAPNGKIVYQVPFSCVWTSRGILNTEDGNITWQAPIQLTTGTRDSNHIWIETSRSGFAMTWQEDTTGLRSGKGEGPGDGWSGATGNHGTDIWYSSLKMEDFNATVDDNTTSKPKSLVNFHYPVRITDNEKCALDDNKLYCKYLCDTYGYVTTDTLNNAGKEITRCKTSYIDMLDNTQVVLNGDTGASRSAFTILETNQGQDVVVFGYEETKSLTINEVGTGDKDMGDNDTNISVEGKSVYFESWDFNALDDFNASDPATIQKVAMPLVSAGQIVNVKAPDQNNTSNLIYENARRLVIGTQVDACDADKFNFLFMYKQSFETQGDSSDMFIRANEGFDYSGFIKLDNREATNISAQVSQADVNSTTYVPIWTTANLDSQTYENPNENTFSPRVYLRANDIIAGYAYTPSAVKTGQGHMPSNFHTNFYVNNAWQGPKNITQLVKASETSEDARLIPTQRGRYEFTGLESDKRNPDTFFVVWGNLDSIDVNQPELGKACTDIFYRRSTDIGANWDPTLTLAAREGSVIEEKEVESIASPDGKIVFNVWIQEEDAATADLSDPFSGLDSWFGRMDYNISNLITN